MESLLLNSISKNLNNRRARIQNNSIIVLQRNLINLKLFIEGNEYLKSIKNELLDHSINLESSYKQLKNHSIKLKQFETEEEQVRFSFYLMEKIYQNSNNDEYIDDLLWDVTSNYTDLSIDDNYKKKVYVELFVNPLCDYLSERLNDDILIVSVQPTPSCQSKSKALTLRKKDECKKDKIRNVPIS